MRNDPKNSVVTPTPTVPQPQGPPNYPGPGGRPNLNPPFDSRLTSTGGANPAFKDRPLKRGRIIRAEGGLQVNFMFNPSVLQVGFSYDGSLPDWAKTDQSPDAPTLASVGEGNVSVDLLFDRTYEVWERQNSIAGQFGVHGDVLAFYAFLGMIDATYTVGSSWEALYPRSQIAALPTYLYIGDTLKYYGYIISLNIQYVHWSYDMIPTRAAVNLGFNVVLSTPQSASSGSSSSTTPTTPTTPGSTGLPQSGEGGSLPPQQTG